MMRIFRSFLVVSLLLSITRAFSQVDETFNPQIFQYGEVASYYLQPDGKLILAGAFTHYNGTAAPSILRLNADGTRDNSFQPGSGPTGPIYQILKSPTGFYVIGYFFQYGGTDKKLIVSIGPDGALSNSFTFNYSQNAAFSQLYIVDGGTVQADGKLIAHGRTHDGKNLIFRLNADGTFDSTFDGGSGFNQQVGRVWLRDDGKMLVSGGFTTYKGATVKGFLRLNADGSPDATFTTDIQKGVLGNIVFQTDGKMVIAGGVSYDGTSYVALSRLNANGTKDDTFTGPPVPGTSITSLTLRTDGKIVIINSYKALFLLSETGAIEKEVELDEEFHHAAALPDNKLLIYTYWAYRNTPASVYQLDVDLAKTTWQEGVPQNASQPNVLVKGADGSVYLAGSMMFYDDHEVEGFIKLKSDLSFDEETTFIPGFATKPEEIYSIAPLANGNLIVTGLFNKQSGGSSSVIRVNKNGFFDPDFTQFYIGWVRGARPVSNGKIIIWGNFTGVYEGKRMLRLHGDGTVDDTFSAPLNAEPSGVVELPDQKLLVWGNFSQHGASNVRRLIRLEANGNLDASFFFSTVTYSIPYDVKLLPDGKYLVAGQLYTSNNGGDENSAALFRLKSNGDLDPDFKTPLGKGSGFQIFLLGDYIAVQSLLADDYGISIYGMDGAYIYPAFKTKTILGKGVMLDDGSLLMSSYPSPTSPRMMTRLKAPLITSVASEAARAESILAYPNPSHDAFSVRSLGEKIVKIEASDVNGRNVPTLQDTFSDYTRVQLRDASRGLYILRITTANHTYFKKVVKE